MKKLVVLAAALVFSMGMSAQDGKMHDKKMHGKEQVMMKDGKMMMMKDDKWVAMDKDMTLADGTVIMADGNVMKDGKKRMLKDGEGVDMNGKVMSHDKMTK